MTPLRTASRALKACSRCRAYDPPCGFWKRYRAADGLDSYCTDCAKVYQGRTRAAAGPGEYPGGYRDIPRGEFYCRKCDLEMETEGGLAHHFSLRHEER